MILSDLLGSKVYDHAGRKLGSVIDARFTMSGDSDDAHPVAILQGFIVSPHSKASTWGYERREVNTPWPIGAFSAWLHRGSFLVRWEDVELLGERRLQLREGARREDASLGRQDGGQDGRL